MSLGGLANAITPRYGLQGRRLYPQFLHRQEPSSHPVLNIDDALPPPFAAVPRRDQPPQRVLQDYNTAKGESSSRALLFYGLQSAAEVISALLVTRRFLSVTIPGDETTSPSKTSHSQGAFPVHVRQHSSAGFTLPRIHRTTLGLWIGL